MPTATDAELLRILTEGDIALIGRIGGSSNHALLVEVALGEHTAYAINKPTRLERPLWDYPHGTLTGRERAAYLVSEAGGFGVVPPTVLREDGPFGGGSLQSWVGDPGSEPALVVDVLAPHEVPTGWVVVLAGESETGRPVVVAHADEPAVRSVAVLDAVLNNSDRKGGHLVRDGARVRGFDHGVSLSSDPKLRTVLWGWAGEPLPEADLTRVERLRHLVHEPGPVAEELAGLLTEEEVDALLWRADELLAGGVHPQPSPGWPAIPWPAM